MNRLDLIGLCRPEHAPLYGTYDVVLYGNNPLWLLHVASKPPQLFLFELERQPDGTIRIWIESPTGPHEPDPRGFRIHTWTKDSAGRPYVWAPVGTEPKTVAEATARATVWAYNFCAAAFLDVPFR